MHEYELLERRWKRYRRKRLLYILIPVLAIFLTLPFFLQPSAQQIKPPAQSKKRESFQKTPQHIKTSEKNDTKKDLPQKLIKQRDSAEKKRKKPTSKTKNFLFLPDKSFEKQLDTLDTTLVTKKEKKTKPVQKEQKKTIQPQTVSKPKNILIQQKSASLKDLINEFYYAPSSSKALIIARKYYEKHRYKESMKWSLKANELNKRSEESWILFAKSLYKLGQKQKAVKTLQFYLHRHESAKAKAVLISMQKGAFND